MARLYSDECVPRSVSVAMRGLGHDILTVREAGKGEQRSPETEVSAFAHSQGRAVVTKNCKHFGSRAKIGVGARLVRWNS